MFIIKNLQKNFSFISYFIERSDGIESYSLKNREEKRGVYPRAVEKKTKEEFPPTKNVLENTKKQTEKLIQELGEDIRILLGKAREKFKNDSETLAKINKIEEELGNILPLYIEELEKESIDDKLQHEVLLEMFKKKIGELKIKLRIIEADAQKEKRYEGVKEEFNKLKEGGEFKDIIGNKTFEQLTAGDFYAMLKTNPELVRSLLLATDKGEVVNINGDWDSVKNKVLRVNFGKNKGLDKIIGAGDILNIFNVKEVEINGVRGIRKSKPRPGYYSVKDGHYLAIHDGYKIKVLDTTKLQGEKEIKEFNNAINKRFEEVRGEEIRKTLDEIIANDVQKGKNKKEIIIPYKSKVDREYIKSFINREENKYLGLELSEDGVLKVGNGFNIGHLEEALSGYKNTKANILKYLHENKHSSTEIVLSIPLSKLGENNEEFVKHALKSLINNEHIKVTVNGENVIIDTSDTNLKIGDIFSIGYEYKGNKYTHEKYKSEIQAAAEKYGIPEGAIIQLIYHENRSWNPRLKAPGSSAYGLGQMINSTWARFGKGNRNNPADQLMATANYMRYIKNVKNCSWEEVLAYYNTGLGIKKVSNINKYYNLNPAIARMQPSGVPRTRENYFIAAVAYYNDLSFYEAKEGFSEKSLGEKYLINGKVNQQHLYKEKLRETTYKNSVILTFIHGKVGEQLKHLNIEKIKKSDSVFLFRNTDKRLGTTKNLSSKEVLKITHKLKNVNSNLKIFIDQEGGKITRFEDFDNNINLRNKYLKDTILNSGISEGNKNKIANILNGIISEKGYPSLATLGKQYEIISDKLKQDYLNAIAYLRLKTLKDRGINTYGLVTDLDEGNPVISGLGRSFSKDLKSYKEFGKAIIDSANKLGMSIYLKHFPGHGAGNVDSHKDVLNYSLKNSNYLRKNISLFKELVDYGKGKVGLMVGHMILPNSFEGEFKDVISKASYVLTDDLGMDGYQLIQKRKIKIPRGKFFTTYALNNSGKEIIKVNLGDRSGIL